MLTAHRVGPKVGPCVVPAIFRGASRKQDQAERIDVALLDADAGHTLQEIDAEMTARGWRAAIASTHSHRTTRTRVKATAYEKWLTEHPGKGPADYLAAVKHMLPRVVADARLLDRIVEQGTEFCVFEHAPCPKYRVAVPLARPWRASDYPD